MRDPREVPPAIDLHLHTTASDGHSDPPDLVRLAWSAGIRTMSVTDHDTVAALPQSAALASAAGIEFVTGIEITAVLGHRDVHMLGYFVDPANRRLAQFLAGQRADRIRRLRAMAARLSELGKPVDVDALLERPADGAGLLIGRPMIARALVRAGYAADVRQAFDELLGDGKPACVPREGASPAEVIALIGEAGGISSLAHPGLLHFDELIPGLASAGLGALEAYHTDHGSRMTAHYTTLAVANGLCISGGSDYHGDEKYREVVLGRTTLPQTCFSALKERAGRTRT